MQVLLLEMPEESHHPDDLTQTTTAKVQNVMKIYLDKYDQSIATTRRNSF